MTLEHFKSVCRAIQVQQIARETCVFLYQEAGTTSPSRSTFRLLSGMKRLICDEQPVHAAVRNQIRECKTSQLRSTIETGTRQGMHLMDHSLRDLYQRGIISFETAKAYAFSLEHIQKNE